MLTYICDTYDNLSDDLKKKACLYHDPLDEGIMECIAKKRNDPNKYRYYEDRIAPHHDIADGDLVQVLDGQCAIVDVMNVKEIVCKPGIYQFSKTGEKTFELGPFDNEFTRNKLKELEKADFGYTHYIYFVNIKDTWELDLTSMMSELLRYVDLEKGIDLDVSVKVKGSLEFKVKCPVSFHEYFRHDFKDEFKMFEFSKRLYYLTNNSMVVRYAYLNKINYDQIVNYIDEIKEYHKEVMKSDDIGIDVLSFNIDDVNVGEWDLKRIKQMEDNYARLDSNYQAMEILFNQYSVMASQLEEPERQELEKILKEQVEIARKGAVCECGFKFHNEKFCMECGKPRPKPDLRFWICPNCKKVSRGGKFCENCGTRKEG